MYSKDPREAYHPAKKMWSPKTPSNSNKALKTAKSASSSAEQADTASKMRYHGGSGRPAEVIALRCSLGSSSVHQCMYGCEAEDGSPIKKPTSFVTNAPELAQELMKRCGDRGGECGRPELCGCMCAWVLMHVRM